MREISTRLAIGAGRGRIFSKMMTESFVLGTAAALTGVALAAGGIAGDLPFASRLGGGPILNKDRAAPKNIWDAPFVLRTAITSGYCRTLRIPLLRGRDLDRRDDQPAAKAALVNEAFARQFLAGEDPVGRLLSYAPGPPDWHQIVGVVNDARQQGAEAAILPQLYIPLYRHVELCPALVVRTAGDPLGYARALAHESRAWMRRRRYFCRGACGRSWRSSLAGGLSILRSSPCLRRLL
jgi:hypothetical protein